MHAKKWNITEWFDLCIASGVIGKAWLKLVSDHGGVLLMLRAGFHRKTRWLEASGPIKPIGWNIRNIEYNDMIRHCLGLEYLRRRKRVSRTRRGRRYVFE